MKKIALICFTLVFSSLYAESCDVLIVGGGPAGLTSGIYASRMGLKVIIAEGKVSGGQLATTHLVENYPGFVNGVDGSELISNMRSQSVKYGAQIKSHDAVSINFDTYPYQVTLSDSEVIHAKSLIIATGSSPKLLGLDSEEALMGSGVSTCAVCDGPLYRNKSVVVVGGGDSAFEDALILSQFAKKVTIIHRSDQFRASTILRNRVDQASNIDIMTFREVVQISDPHKGEVESIIILNSKTKQKEQLFCDGVFIAIGQKPNTSWLGDKIKLDESGMIQNTPEGVFAAGDVSDQRYRQAITAAGSGCKAALDAYHYLKLDKENGR